VVKVATCRTTKTKFAIKTYDKIKLLDPQKKKNLQREISVLSSLKHNNIMKLFKTIETVRHTHLVMEYAGTTSLRNFLKQKRGGKLEDF